MPGENDAEAIYAAFQKVLRKGSPYAFQVLSDRAWGKLKETHAIEQSPFQGQPDEDLEKKVKELEIELGYLLPDEPKVLPPGYGSLLRDGLIEHVRSDLVLHGFAP